MIRRHILEPIAARPWLFAVGVLVGATLGILDQIWP